MDVYVLSSPFFRESSSPFVLPSSFVSPWETAFSPSFQFCNPFFEPASNPFFSSRVVQHRRGGLSEFDYLLAQLVLRISLGLPSSSFERKETPYQEPPCQSEKSENPVPFKTEPSFILERDELEFFKSKIQSSSNESLKTLLTSLNSGSKLDLVDLFKGKTLKEKEKFMRTLLLLFHPDKNQGEEIIAGAIAKKILDVHAHRNAI